jgi:ankyrin repeat protein
MSVSIGGADPADKLRSAAFQGNIKAVRRLLSHGTDVNAADSDGNTPLMYAAQEAHPGVVACLLAAGARVDARNARSETPLLFAGRQENSVVLADNLRGATDPGYVTDTATASALDREQQGLTESVRLLLAAGTDVNAADMHGCTPLLAYTQGNQDGIVPMLLEEGADVNATDHEGSSALMLAAINGNRRVVALLLAHGAEVNGQDNHGYTPVMLAIKTGAEPGLVRMLLVAGGKWNGPG